MQTDNVLLSKKASATTDLVGPYHWRHGLLFFKGRVVVPNDPELRTRILPEINELLKLLKSNLATSINRMKQMADKKCREQEFQVNDWVLLKLHPYRQQTVFTIASQKLSNRYYGPYQILEHLGSVAYKLLLTDSARIHPVFHVSLLKPYYLPHDNLIPPTIDLPPFNEEGVVALEPQQVLETRWVNQGAKLVHESLVKWKVLPLEEATWESTSKLREHFSHSNLKDKILLEEGSNDRSLRRSRQAPHPNPKYFA
ncbi:hypothetical protein F0562_002031 [Nyssa sinensis]|uniref:Uncharacterized protein n=1 Tax=Nyssa sinensis TaxID=561372 RepID=A0A5J5C8N0_9ASTE|nr:hypothetical protein F0562_002031 [Nyssa sinensis]